MRKKTQAKLSRRYYNPQQTGSFGGVQALARASGVKRKQVKKWLSSQDTFTLHKPVRHRFPRRKTVVSGKDDQWQADLVDVKSLKKHNDGVTFLLTVIDVLSKYAWVVPLRNKTGPRLKEAFDHIFSQGRKPCKLQTDKGTEFKNREVQAFLKDQGVHFFTTENSEIKAAIVERFNRTLQERLYRYLTRKSSSRYVDALQSLVLSYNRSYHGSIKRAPADVTDENEEDVWQTLYGQPVVKRVRPKLQVGDRVRISKARRQFKKGYLPSWSEELFTVSRVKRTTPVTYILKDDHHEELWGTFYEPEVQKVADKSLFKIEKVLDERYNSSRKERELLVQWKGYPASFNSWILQRDLQTYKG